MSLLGTLKAYRKPGSDSNQNGLSLVDGKKRIQMMPDSESENEAGTPEKKVVAKPTAARKSGVLDQETVRIRQEIFISLRRDFPDLNVNKVTQALSDAEWNIEKAKEALLGLPLGTLSVVKPAVQGYTVETAPTGATTTVKRQITSPSPSVTVNEQPKKKKRLNEDNDSDADQDRPKEKVFDSDDDDSDEGTNYYSTYMSKDRRMVFDFINTANVSELTKVKTLSTKKAEMIMEGRPFKTFEELVLFLKSQKSLQTEILNHTQDYMSRRNSLVTIMNKCDRIVSKLETAISYGGKLKEQPSNIAEGFKLAEYQMVGLNWLVILHNNEVNGILADEMGLGKTIQVIAFLAFLKEHGLSHLPHLIVVPSSTLDNWSNEMKKWCPDLEVVKYYGSQEERRMQRVEWARNGLSGIDVVLTTYHMMGASGEEKKMWRVTKFDYVIFDEAHMLKNMTTQRYANLLRINSERRILLTGTPLQNNLLELMSLLCFVMPSMFAAKSEDIKSLFQQTKTKTTEGGDGSTSFEQAQIDRAKKIMKPFILRRLKKDVLSFLPKKSEHICKVPMLESQREKYLALVEQYKTEARSSHQVSGIGIMSDMRKLANHPLLQRYYFSDDDVRNMAKKLARDPDWKGSKNPNEVFQDIAYLSDFKLYELREKYDNLSDVIIPDKLILGSGKFRKLDELLPNLKAGGHRVLIFSQFVMMLDILEKYLDIRGYGYLRLDGSTAVDERQELIDLYSSDSNIFIFLLSTRAGGLGINLTAADTVIIHDIDFNPYNDKQAEDRAHRMGQTKPVTIHKLISEGSIEEGMLMVANEKLQLEREVTEEDEAAVQREEHKCMVRLLTMALGMDANKAETILNSPPPKKKTDEDF